MDNWTIVLIVIETGILLYGIFTLRKYYRYKAGQPIKGIITHIEVHHKSGNKQSATLSYTYEIDGKLYDGKSQTNKELYLLKPHAIKGESISILVQLNDDSKSITKDSLSSVLYIGICAIVMSIFCVVIVLMR